LYGTRKNSSLISRVVFGKKTVQRERRKMIAKKTYSRKVNGAIRNSHGTGFGQKRNISKKE